MLKNVKIGAGHVLVAIGLGAAILSTTMNTVHGYESALWMAVLFFLVEVARAAIPFIAATRGWTGHLKVTFGFIIFLSLFASANFAADYFGMSLLGRGKEVELQDGKKNELAKLEAKINAIPELASEQALLGLAKAEADRKDKPGCGTGCLAYTARAAIARTKEELKKEYVELKKTIDAEGPIKTSGMGLFIANVAGISIERATAGRDIAQGIAALLAIDLLVYLIIPGAKWLREDRHNEKLSGYGAVEIKATKTKADGTKKVSKAEAYRKVVAMLLETSEGSILTSRRRLALEIGVPKTTFSGWMADWAADGSLLIATKAKGKELVSLRKAA